ESVALPAAAAQILQVICDSLGWDLGVLWTVDRHANLLRCVEVWHPVRVQVPAFLRACQQRTFCPGIGLPGRIWASGSPAWIPDVTRDSHFPRASIAAQEGLHGAVGFPIHNDSEFLGVMEFFSEEIRQPEEALLQLMSSIGSQISQVLERRRAEKALYERE